MSKPRKDRVFRPMGTLSWCHDAPVLVCTEGEKWCAACWQYA